LACSNFAARWSASVHAQKAVKPHKKLEKTEFCKQNSRFFFSSPSPDGLKTLETPLRNPRKIPSLTIH